MELTAKDIFEIRKSGRIEEAYEAARQLYASDKGDYTSAAMFWTAVDVLKLRVAEDRTEEAGKIYLALERLLSKVDDNNGWMRDAIDRCRTCLEQGRTREKSITNGPRHLQTGVWGEELASAYLRDKDYIILERDWHSTHRDIDIIAKDGECIVFVEVKTRKDNNFADPIAAVNYKKLKNLRLAINHYIHYRKLDGPWRFDVITIVGEPGCTNPEISHIEDFAL